MRSNILSLLIAIASVAFIVSCGNDNLPNPCPNGKLPLTDTVFSFNEEYYDNPSNFKIYTKSTVTLAKGAFGAFGVSGQSNIINRFRTFQKGDTFNIDYDNCIFKFKPLEITVFGISIDKLTIHDSSVCQFSSDFGQESLSLILNDQVSGNIDGQFGSLNIENNSSMPLSLNGQHGNLWLEHNGLDEFSALEALITNANLKNNANTDIYISAVETLTVNISGSGNVYYEGEPVLEVKSTGTGQAIKLE